MLIGGPLYSLVTTAHIPFFSVGKRYTIPRSGSLSKSLRRLEPTSNFLTELFRTLPNFFWCFTDGQNPAYNPFQVLSHLIVN